MSVVALLAGAPSSAGAVSFSPLPGSPFATSDPGGESLGGATAGDFNNDKISDVAVVNETGVPALSSGESVSVLLGSASDGLTPAPSSPVSIYSGGYVSEPAPIATGDFNHDGNADLAVVDSIHNTLAILLGNGHGEFHMSGTPTSFSGWGAASSLAVGDFNGDGKEDVAVVNEGVNILLGNGSGGLAQAPESPMPLPAYGFSAVAGKFDGSGRAGLAVSDISRELLVYLSNSAGEMTATTESPIALGAGGDHLTSADLNDDGNADLAVASSSGGDVAVLLGDGSGGFTQVSDSPFPIPGAASEGEPGLPESIAVGAFTCSDLPDLAAANYNGGSDTVAVLEGDGSGMFTNPPGYLWPVNGNPRSILVGDFNGDGKPDVAVVNPFLGTITALENTTPTPEYCPPPNPTPPSPPKPPSNPKQPVTPVSPPPSPTPGGTTVLAYQASSPPPGTMPSIEALSLRRHLIHVGRGLSLRLTLSGSATVVVELEKRGRGHGLHAVGSVSLAGHPGVNSFTIKRVGHKLVPGHYTLMVFLRQAGHTSAVKTLLGLTVMR